MNSKKAYRILKGQNTFVNFSNQKISIGDVFEMDKKNHRKVMNVFDFISREGIEDKIEYGPKSEFEFMSKNTFNLEFSNQQNSSPILAHQASITFSRAKSVYCKLENLRHASLPIAYIEEELKGLWEKKGFNKGVGKRNFHFVSEVFEAEQGILLYNRSAGTSAKFICNSKAPLLEETDLLKNEVEIKADSSQFMSLNLKEAFIPFYKTLRQNGSGRFEYL
jgi:hypothetical protein